MENVTLETLKEEFTATLIKTGWGGKIENITFEERAKEEFAEALIRHAFKLLTLAHRFFSLNNNDNEIIVPYSNVRRAEKEIERARENEY